MRKIRADNRVTCTWKENVDVSMERFFPTANMCRGTRVVSNQIKRWFEWDNVKRAVGSIKLKKAPLDGICAEMLRVIWRAIPVWLKSMYDLCFSTKCFSKAWKTAKIVVLLKSLDKVRSDPGSYRPICLLPVFGKGLERMMVRRLKQNVSDKMCDAQYGFVTGRSIEGAWSRVSNCKRIKV